MNLFAVSFLIIAIPLVSQIVLGSLSILHRLKMNFDLICIVNIFSQVAMIFLGFIIVTNDAEKQGVNCGMPQAAIIFYGVAVFIALTVTIGIQIIIRKFRRKRYE